MKIPFLNLSWQHNRIKDKVSERLQNIFDTTSFHLGKDVELFEGDFASYIGAHYAVGVANGTDALILAIKALDLEPGAEIITIPTTFIATASAIVHAGARPVFVDIDPETRDFNFELLEKAITPNTKAIIPVHLYGQPSDMDTVLSIAQKYNLYVIEDTSQAHGALYKGKRIGTFGHMATFSFYAGKNLGGYGDGGAVVTNDEAYATKLKKLRNHGGIIKYQHELLGYNSRLDTIQAAILDEKLPLLDSWNEMRNKIAQKYDQDLSGINGLEIYPTRPNTTSVYHLYVIRLKNGEREKFIKYMNEKEIGVGIHYPDPLHLVPALKMLHYKQGDFPAAEAYTQEIVSLPIFPGMTEEETDYVINAIKHYYE